MSMLPPATSISAPPRMRRPWRSAIRTAAALLLLAGYSLHLGACSGDEWPDRDPLIVEHAPVDSLEFLPADTRYLLADSLTPIRVSGMRLGYACTRVLSLDLEGQAFAQPHGFAARMRLELPATPTCALDDSTRDSVLLRRFALSEGPVVRLVDSSGAILDSAWLAPGVAAQDSLVTTPKATGGLTFRGRFYYYDTTAEPPYRHRLASDSLGACERLYRAERTSRGDTTTVRYTLVTLDSLASPGICDVVPRRDSLTVLPARP